MNSYENERKDMKKYSKEKLVFERKPANSETSEETAVEG